MTRYRIPVRLEEDYPSEITGLEANSDYTVSLSAIDQCNTVIDSIQLTASAKTYGKILFGRKALMKIRILVSHTGQDARGIVIMCNICNLFFI